MSEKTLESNINLNFSHEGFEVYIATVSMIIANGSVVKGYLLTIISPDNKELYTGLHLDSIKDVQLVATDQIDMQITIRKLLNKLRSN